MSDLTGDLLRVVAETQRDKTLNDVRDAMDTVPLEIKSGYSTRRITGAEFRTELIEKLKGIRNE